MSVFQSLLWICRQHLINTIRRLSLTWIFKRHFPYKANKTNGSLWIFLCLCSRLKYIRYFVICYSLMFKDNYTTVFYFRLVKNLGKPCAEVRLQAHTAGGLRVFCSFILVKPCMADAIINFTGNKYNDDLRLYGRRSLI